ncbi:peptidase T [Neolewinella persica]|uniref:peptidase T n=1 Tax=Neolewinella persica TaxID=70998 RepID=UPI000370EA26|nr:peptidase T [Neolewinella persica]
MTTLLDRFLRYVKIDTQSDAHSLTQPSTMKQKDLGKILAEELLELGLSDAHLDEHGYVYATLPATPGHEGAPVICFCSHMDTSPDASGKDVKPLVHKNYQGQDLVLPDDESIVIRMADHAGLDQCIGQTIITASGTTLLGADNKSGVAAIMTAVATMVKAPSIAHGKLRILFTPDEEIGRGVNAVDMEKLGADFGYTIDGEEFGSLQDETFSADGARIDITGVSAHPGMAKGHMENAIKIAADIISALPKDRLSPETTEGKEGFIHPVEMEAKAESARIDFIIRDFDNGKLLENGQVLKDIAVEVGERYPKSTIKVTFTEQYRNMKHVLDENPHVMQLAEKAISNVGITPKPDSIRGGTDGSRLSFMGLPCPNIFAGEHAFHSKYEWASLEEMEAAAKVVVEIARLASVKS